VGGGTRGLGPEEGHWEEGVGGDRMRDKWSVGNIRAIGESGDHQSREEKGGDKLSVV